MRDASDMSGSGTDIARARGRDWPGAVSHPLRTIHTMGITPGRAQRGEGCQRRVRQRHVQQWRGRARAERPRGAGVRLAGSSVTPF